LPSEFETDVHDLLADVRAVSAALADPSSNIILNMELGGAAYARGPWHAVFVATQIAALRLLQIERVRRLQGLGQTTFPAAQLLSGLAGQTEPRRACVEVLERWVESVPSREPIQQLVDEYGVLAFMQMVQVANRIGEMLAEVDPEFEDLADLLQKEALADEHGWGVLPE